MKNIPFSEYWQAFLHWKGWRICGRFFVRCGKAAAGWGGWQKIFCIPFPVLLVMGIASGAGLILVFVRGLEQTVPAYILYAVSAYTLTGLCIRFPGAFRAGKAWLGRHPKIAGLLKNAEFKFRLELYFEQLINFGYGIFKIASGVILGSAWIGCDGIYNLTQALIQLFQILRRKKAETLLQQWKSYRFCGFLILLMHLTLTGIVFQMVNWNRAEDQGPIMVIATAAFAFYKFTGSFWDLARDRKHTRPVDSSVRMLDLAQAIFAMFSLQASMFHTFGTGESWEQLMNLITGCTVCLLIVSMGIYMIRRANREIKKLQEVPHGE